MLLKKHKNTLAVFIFFLAVILIIASVSPSFRSYDNFCNLLVQFIPLAILSLSQTLVIIVGGIDLSVGIVMAFTTTILATTTADFPHGITIGLSLVLFYGFLVGLFNAFGAALLDMPPMIVTLCSQTILQGITLTIMNRQGGKIELGFATFLSWRSGPFSTSLFILVILYLIVMLVLTKTGWGLHLYACGNNTAIADTLGVNVKRTRAIAYISASLLAVLAGIVMTGRLRSGDPTVGASYGLDSITATLIGGASLAGGEGIALGSVFGALIIGVLSNIMNSLGVSSFYQQVLKGLILIFTMAIYSVANSMESKKNVF